MSNSNLCELFIFMQLDIWLFWVKVIIYCYIDKKYYKLIHRVHRVFFFVLLYRQNGKTIINLYT
jgi:hypothetical protein